MGVPEWEMSQQTRERLNDIIFEPRADADVQFLSQLLRQAIVEIETIKDHINDREVSGPDNEDSPAKSVSGTETEAASCGIRPDLFERFIQVMEKAQQ